MKIANTYSLDLWLIGSFLLSLLKLCSAKSEPSEEMYNSIVGCPLYHDLMPRMGLVTKISSFSTQIGYANAFCN